MSRVHVSSHPLVGTHLARLRDCETSPPEFRRRVRALTSLLIHEATREWPTTTARVETPLGPAPAVELEGNVALVPILRAGLGMVEAALELLPDAAVWHLGLYRDEATLQPMTYYDRLPNPLRAARALVIDPMLATGGSAVRACGLIAQAGVPAVSVVSIIAAPEGIARLTRDAPDVRIFVGALDERLTEAGFIYPGLGDAGDRLFATAPHLAL